jgi:transcriptional regulator GlxA family with amidase domain
MQRQDYERAASDYFTKDPQGKLEFQKFYSSDLLQQVVDEMQRTTLPTVTAARITVAKLVREGELVRTDGRTEEDDRVQLVAAAQANLDKVVAEIDAEPLTPSELAYFGSLSQRELSRLFYGEDGDAVCEFAVRYRKASREFGFQIPAKFGDQS